MKNKIKYLVALALAVIFSVSLAFSVSAEEAPEGESVSAEEQEQSPLSKIYDEISAYTSEILAALTLVGSVTLAFAYKKGLLPLMEKSLITIGNAVTGIMENTEKNTVANTAMGESIEKQLLHASEAVTALSKRIGELDNDLRHSLEGEESQRLEAKELRLVIGAQIDMLYDIFMSSALPQYQKDAVGERIAKMKEAIAENASEE